MVEVMKRRSEEGYIVRKVMGQQQRQMMGGRETQRR
jgi:hypothetical protein